MSTRTSTLPLVAGPVESVAVAAGETPSHRDERGKFHPTTYASPAKYANPESSGLTAKVEDKAGQTFEFRLER